MSDRKRRCDRNHIIYLLLSPSGKRYLGLTFVRDSAKKRSLEERWSAHVRNAMEYGHDTLLCRAIREEGAENFGKCVVCTVRGKAEAHEMERKFIAQMKPELNMEGMGRKRL